MKLKAKNFLSWADLEFETGKGVTLIRGYNFDDGTEEGSGKSAILNALCWCIYGEIPKEACIDDVVKEGTKNCEVTVELPEFTLFRSRNPNDLQIIFGAPGKLGKSFRGSTAVHTQKEIVRLLGSFKTFCQSIYFAQNYPNKFVTANQEDKGKILSEILDLEQFDRARKNVSEKMKPLKEEIHKAEMDCGVKSSQVASDEKSLNSFTFLLEEFQREKVAKIQKLLRDHETMTAEAQNFEVEFNAKKADELKNINTLIAGCKKQRKALLEESKNAEEELKELEKEDFETVKKTLEAEIEGITQAREEAKSRLAAIESEMKAFNRMKKDIATREEDLEKNWNRIKAKEQFIQQEQATLEECQKELTIALQAQENPSKENCPTCKQPWNGDPAHYAREVFKARKTADNAQRSVDSGKAELVQLKTQNSDITSNLSALNAEFLELKRKGLQKPDELENIVARTTKDRDAVKAALKEVLNEETKLAYVRHDIELIAQKLKDVKRHEADLELQADKIIQTSPAHALEKFANKISALEAEINAEDAKQPDSLEANLKTTKKDLEKARAGLKAAQAQVENLKTAMIRLEALRDGYRDVKAYTFENTLRQLSSKANLYLGQLFNQQVTIRFKNEDLKIETLVKIDGHERPLGLYSGGQFRRIALAVDLALADVTLSRKGNKLNLMIMDEYFKDLSLTSMGRILKILQARKTPTLLIEHNDLFSQIVNNRVMVELRKGTSVLVQDEKSTG
jgi:DNA repair exonuclease SbcCD ATPase subunit